MSATAAKRRANCMISDTQALDGADEDHLRRGERHSSTSGRATSPLSRPDGGQANDCAICGWRAPRARDHAFFIQIDSGTSRVVPTNHTDPFVGTSGRGGPRFKATWKGLFLAPTTEERSPSTAAVHLEFIGSWKRRLLKWQELASTRLVRGRATLSTFFDARKPVFVPLEVSRPPQYTHADKQATPMTDIGGINTDTAAGHI
ncbi:uncharacterized protein SCHCODRAFT_02663686 [Schizophyllum commune H4-8]|nr:uncharacterized protein SCHCODRAFT_02663686 [Schizophyllum commune H4-8]KAI5898830.1 hypothetical protein SCHCODRAFT_02663686 [Schizophyllum commune H4-8]